MAKTTKKKKTNKKKTKGRKKVVKAPDTVVPVSTPDGSVHFDEFLKQCKEPKLLVPTEPVVKGKKKTKKLKTKRGVKNKKKAKKTKKTKKATKTKKQKKGGKKSKKTKAVKLKEDTQNETGSVHPTLFPLIKALLQSTEGGDPHQENDIFSEFVVGKTDPLGLKHQTSLEEKNLIEQEANAIIDDIKEAEEKIKTLMEKPRLTEPETVELDAQQVLLINLLKNFENCLEKFQNIFHAGQQQPEHENDEDNWLDVNDEDVALADTQRRRPDCDYVAADVEPPKNAGGKWYEDGCNLAYLLSPNTSFDKKRSLSSDILKIFEELNITEHTEAVVNRKEVFNRLKKKFHILLPPVKMERTDHNLARLERKFYKGHQEMLDSTKDLKLFECWNQLEVQYNMISALMISLKDAIKSTDPFYYANQNVKSQFVADQSVLVQRLDELKRKTKDAFMRVGLDDYWKILPESIKLGAKPCFEITIRRNTVNDDDDNDNDNDGCCDNAAGPPDERKMSTLLRRDNPFVARSKCQNVKKENSKDSEIEVRNVNYNNALL